MDRVTGSNIESICISIDFTEHWCLVVFTSEQSVANAAKDQNNLTALWFSRL